MASVTRSSAAPFGGIRGFQSPRAVLPQTDQLVEAHGLRRAGRSRAVRGGQQRIAQCLGSPTNA